jgi:hypothetical protein
MNTIYVDSPVDDLTRRARLYAGDLLVYTPRPSTKALCALARALAEEAFSPRDPRTAQHDMPVEEYAGLLADLKPRFIHHPRAKQLIQEMLVDMGCDPDQTYFDVPRMRTATADGYLTSGIAYAFHPHRDTWYSAPMCQVNWWLPLYEIESENCLAFHPQYWTRAVKNGSSEYNYYAWNAESRKNAAQHIKSDTRKQPHAEEPLALEPQVRVVCPPGGAILFSAAQMHSTVPNTTRQTRFSIDFRTVNLEDARRKGGAPNLDSASTGTVLRDFLRVTDLAHIPDEVVALHDDGTHAAGVLVFDPAAASPTMATASRA